MVVMTSLIVSTGTARSEAPGVTDGASPHAGPSTAGGSIAYPGPRLLPRDVAEVLLRPGRLRAAEPAG